MPEVFHSVMKYHSRKIDRALSPGLIQITWTSLNVDNFLTKVKNAISQFERFTKQVSSSILRLLQRHVTHTVLCSWQVLDLYECRIQANLKIMSRTHLLTLPQNEAWTTEYFLHESRVRSELGGRILSSCSIKVEDAVKELLMLLISTAYLPTINSFDSEDVTKSKKDEIELFENQCDDLFTYFRLRNLEALISSVRTTLDNFRRCITTSTSRSNRTYPSQISSSGGKDETSHPTACFQADLILSLPNIVMRPSLEDMQNTVNQTVLYVCEIGQFVKLWTPPHYSITHAVTSSGATLRKNYYGFSCSILHIYVACTQFISSHFL